MSEYLSLSVFEQLFSDFKQESRLVNLMIRGCIELRWAIAEEEKEIAEAMIYNAFEEYVMARGMPLKAAEKFCEQNLEELIQRILAIL